MLCRFLSKSRLVSYSRPSVNVLRKTSTKAPKPFHYQELLSLTGEDPTTYRKLTGDYVQTTEFKGSKILEVAPEALTLLTEEAMVDISHLLRSSHLQQLRNILDDPEASPNDRYVAMTLLRNANIAAGMVLPGCQDTGTAIVIGKKGGRVWTDGRDGEHLSRGVYNTYTNKNLRYSQVAPLDMYKEVNTGTNLPAQIELYSVDGNEYHFLFIAKGGGSANKSFLYQQTKAVLNEQRLTEFLTDQIRTIGTAACPPYHLAVVVGGLSAELNLKVVKLASTKYLDRLPTKGDEYGHAFRDLEMEAKIHKVCQGLGIGAQFGGKYFCHDVRVVRMPRHGASCPIGIGVSCSADRQALGKITEEGVFLEELERDPSKYIPEVTDHHLSEEVVKVDLKRPMSEVLNQLSQFPVKTRLSLTGTLIVARDIAHAKLLERLEEGRGLPDYFKDHPVYYAGPAKTPEGYASGSFGPTTAGRMDSYVSLFQAEGGSMVMLAKGNRSKQDFTYLKVNMLDSEEETLIDHYQKCTSFIDQGRELGKVLIHCNAGCSRSVAMAICYAIHKNSSRSVQAVLEDLRRTRPAANPNKGFMTQLYAIEASTMSNPPL